MNNPEFSEQEWQRCFHAAVRIHENMRGIIIMTRSSDPAGAKLITERWGPKVAGFIQQAFQGVNVFNIRPHLYDLADEIYAASPEVKEVLTSNEFSQWVNVQVNRIKVGLSLSLGEARRLIDEMSTPTPYDLRGIAYRLYHACMKFKEYRQHEDRYDFSSLYDEAFKRFGSSAKAVLTELLTKPDLVHRFNGVKQVHSWLCAAYGGTIPCSRDWREMMANEEFIKWLETTSERWKLEYHMNHGNPLGEADGSRPNWRDDTDYITAQRAGKAIFTLRSKLISVGGPTVYYTDMNLAMPTQFRDYVSQVVKLGALVDEKYGPTVGAIIRHLFQKKNSGVYGGEGLGHDIYQKMHAEGAYHTIVSEEFQDWLETQVHRMVASHSLGESEAAWKIRWKGDPRLHLALRTEAVWAAREKLVDLGRNNLNSYFYANDLENAPSDLIETYIGMVMEIGTAATEKFGSGVGQKLNRMLLHDFGASGKENMTYWVLMELVRHSNDGNPNEHYADFLVICGNEFLKWLEIQVNRKVMGSVLGEARRLIDEIVITH